MPLIPLPLPGNKPTEDGVCHVNAAPNPKCTNDPAFLLITQLGLVFMNKDYE